MGNESNFLAKPVSNKWYLQHRVLLFVIFCLLLVAIAVWFYLKPTSSQNYNSVATIPKSNTNSVVVLAPTQSALVPVSSTTQTAGLFIPSRLAPLADLKLIKPAAIGGDINQVRYFEVKGISVNGAKIILLFTSGCGAKDNCTPDEYNRSSQSYRFLQNGNEYTLLTKYSTPFTYGLMNLKNESDLNSKISDMDISALDVPSQLQDPKTKAIIKFNSDSFYSGSFFDPKGKTLIFSSDGYNVFLPNGSADESYVTESPDGKELWYQLQDTFLPKDYGTQSLNIQWNSGITHSNNYMYDTFDCGEGADFINAAKNTSVTLNDLVAVGIDKDAGQPVYSIKDPNNPLLVAVKNLEKEVDQSAQFDPPSSAPQYSPYDIVYWKDPFGRLIRFVGFGMLGCGGKPVIYLYPTVPTNVAVQVAPAGGISKSVPEYGNGWNVLAQPSGTLTYENTQYPYLYWEGGISSYKMPNYGFVVSKSDVKALLDTKLAFLGLNQKEVNDFEQFWLLRMQSAPYYFVTFTTNSDVEKYAPLTISPKPDTTIRVFMDYKPLQAPEKVAPLQLFPTARKGFTVVEWGGILK